MLASPVLTVLILVTAGLWLAVEMRQARRRRPEAMAADRTSLLVLRASAVIGGVGALGRQRRRAVRL